METLEATKILNLTEAPPLLEQVTQEQAQQVVLLALATEKARRDQVFNMIANLRPNRSPYFAR